jgi:hypothetical protein
MTGTSHADLGQSDLAALCAAAGDTELAEAEAGPVSSCGYPLTGADPLAATWPALTEAGFTLHHYLRKTLPPVVSGGRLSSRMRVGRRSMNGPDAVTAFHC